MDLFLDRMNSRSWSDHMTTRTRHISLQNQRKRQSSSNHARKNGGTSNDVRVGVVDTRQTVSGQRVVLARRTVLGIPTRVRILATLAFSMVSLTASDDSSKFFITRNCPL